MQRERRSGDLGWGPDVVEPAVLEFMNRLPRAGVSS